jgi:hypothetical protein
MAEMSSRVVRQQTEEQRAELRRLLDAPKLTQWDQGRLRALAQRAPEREHREALAKLERIADNRRAKREGNQAGSGQRNTGGRKTSVLGRDFWTEDD